ncbi:MAG: xanthine dehydrogenase family protein molybdopterin-binding subunit [Armatimonadota bacterium]|nr:xanthine dehydrogenase family protein molybdopterin-binding subunit [Armatimonadota bacterium]MDR7438754.1 xanthine dehydrogenase family protein molybdopterin-binding subunit [Armatimonadota bacterium]MDR7561970.1 xanthine dehydrogenase family protein molybdopterin-binding subunit [Armatimonadota bacterium]MDR7566917.1 xanthine dehydrogenase family protein molybdopterin-binding subunit [Armatimonadota bacterium]
METRWIGRPLRRREDPRFLRGEARYLDDLVLPGMLHMVVVRSPYAHGVLRAVQTERARGVPGVVAVVTAEDLPPGLQGVPPAPVEGAEVAFVPHPLLARDRVRYVGEPVAAVVAETRAAASDAAAEVELEVEPLPAVVHLQEALRGEVRLHEAVPDNVLFRWRRAGGDPEAAFRRAARVVRGRFRIPRLAAVPLEPRGALAAYDPGTGTLTLWCSAQGPHQPRMQLSRILRHPEDRIRVVVPDVGGAFGSKGSLPPEAALAAWAAMRLRRPVKWVETRRENLQASYQGRGLEAEVEMAVEETGRITGVRATLWADAGAYLYPSTVIPPVTAAMLLTGAYAIPAAEVTVLGVATNKVPTGPYRGAGRPEAAYLVERMVDLVARELDLDPMELRLRNCIPPDAFPYRTPLGFTYDSGNYPQVLQRLQALLEADGWRTFRERARAEGRLVGIGAALYVERVGAREWESASVSVLPSGRVVVRTGSTPHGQGHETTFAQIAAELLHLDVADVAVQYGDSAVVPPGVGTFGSRSTTIGGSALVVALRKIREKATRIAAHLLEAAEADIEWEGAQLRVRGAPGRAVSWQELAAAAYQPGRLPPGMELGLDAYGYFTLPGLVFPYGAYGALVEVDRETGEVKLLKLLAVDDAGRVINPLLAEGQVRGGIAQGIGQALLEEVVYREDGQLLTASLAEYAVPRAGDIPEVETELVETPSPLNPLGAKGIGEAGTIGMPVAVANAVMDALRPVGIRHLDFPFRSERVWWAIRERASEGR